MKTFSFLAGCILLLAASASAQDKAELKKQIVGIWETTHKGPERDYPITAEFKGDGKLVIKINEITVNGTYSIIADGKVETETTFEGKKRTVKQDVKIKQDTMELKDPDGPLTTFKRKK